MLTARDDIRLATCRMAFGDHGSRTGLVFEYLRAFGSPTTAINHGYVQAFGSPNAATYRRLDSQPQLHMGVGISNLGEVGVGYHHPPTQWPYTPMGVCQGGNSAAVAYVAPARFASWNFRVLGVSVAGRSMHAEFAYCHSAGTSPPLRV